MTTQPDDAPNEPRTILQRSANTEHFLAADRPRLRGLLHLAAAVITVPAALVTPWLVPTGEPRVAVASFATGVATMFTASAALHRRRWKPHVLERLLRLDHCGIYAAIVGTGIAVGVLGLDGWPARVLLTAALVGGGLGIVAEWMPFAPPRGYSNTVYLTLGWTPVVLLPWLWSTAGPRAVVLLVIGGVIYTIGAVVVGARRPNPIPGWFGYHEIFHLMVILAVIVHAVMVAELL